MDLPLKKYFKIDKRTLGTISSIDLLKRKKDSPPVDHFCFEIDDEWVVGYGLDDNSLKRNYRNIYKIN